MSLRDRLIDWIVSRPPDEGGCPFLLGLAGGQGIGKSYLSRQIEDRSEGRVAILSLDDYYLTKAQRAAMADEVHPLLATRGVPGTHDIKALSTAIDTLSAAGEGGETLLRRFDKITDDTLPPSQWGRFSGRPTVIVVEGWCINARPAPEASLSVPLNPLEREEDAGEVWRRYANAQLAGEYRAFFDRFDSTVLLKPASFDMVIRWRIEQEISNYRDQGLSPPDDLEDRIVAFVANYERITRRLIEDDTSFDIVIEVSGPARDWRLVRPAAL